MENFKVFKVWDVHEPNRFKRIFASTPSTAKYLAQKEFFKNSNFLDLRARDITVNNIDKLIPKEEETEVVADEYIVFLKNGTFYIVKLIGNEGIKWIPVDCYLQVTHCQPVPREFEIYYTSEVTTLQDMIYLYNSYVSSGQEILKINRFTLIFEEEDK